MAFITAMFRRDRWPLWLGGAVGVAIIVWLLRDFDYRRFIDVVRSADIRPLVLVPIAVIGEQLLRSLKWRLLLAPHRVVRISHLFSAIMVGYFANLLAPVRVSLFVRSWLVARREDLKVSTVLATATVDRVIDGWVYLGFAAVVAGTIPLADEGGVIRTGLWRGFAGALAGLAAVVAGLIALKRSVHRPPRILQRIARRLPLRLVGFVGGAAVHFGQGVALPRGVPAILVLFGAAVVMKLLATTHLVWAGMAFGVVLEPMQYLFLMVFLGFLGTLAGVLRIVGGYAAGGVFALGLFGVGVEKALAIALAVEVSTHLTTAVIGGVYLAIEGIGIGKLRNLARPADRTGDSRT